MDYIEHVGISIPLSMIYGFCSLPWRIFNKTEQLIVQWYQTREKEIFVALDKSIFYNYFLKKKTFRAYLKNSPKKLILKYNKTKLVQRVKRESLSLSQFMRELGEVTKLAIFLPKNKNIIDRVFGILEETQSFEVVQIILKNREKLLKYSILKYIIGARTKRSRLEIKFFLSHLNEGKVRLNYRNRGFINEIRSNLQPLWSKLRHFIMSGLDEMT